MKFRSVWLAITFTDLLLSFAQGQDLLRFEAASIKARVLTDDRGPANAPKTTIDSGMLRMTLTTAGSLIEFAYGCKSSTEIANGPDWLFRQHYDVVAETQRPATKDEQRLMMQALLVERFRLSCHRDTRDVPGFALLRGKSLKMKASVGPPASVLIPPTHIQRGDEQIFKYSEKGVSMAQLAEWLWGRYARPIVDKTGLPGIFDFELLISADEAMSPQDFMAAIQAQLGLKVEAQHVPIQIVVIDHIDRASEN
jgi:uncharacterized protein (TIGR03435 family)